MKEINMEFVENLNNTENQLCISIYMPTKEDASSEVKKMPIQLKNLLNQIKKELQEKNHFDDRKIDALLKPASDLLGDRVFWQNQKKGLALFLTPDKFNYYHLSDDVQSISLVGQYFYVLPLISEAMFNKEFYVLALSRNQNRIFSCTRGSIDQITIQGIPESLKEITKYSESEKSLHYHTHGSEGSKSIFHGLGEIEDDKREELLQYFRQIDLGLNKEIDKKNKSPLIIMCVKDLFPLYREINNYPYLFDKNIEGNPDETNPNTIHDLSWNIVKGHFQSQVEEIYKLYHNIKGTGKTSTLLDEIVSAAYFSRVENLLIKKHVFQFGDFDSEENKVHLEEDGRLRYNQYDLYNYAAIKTLSNGGQVYVLEENEMPDGENMIAFFRF